MRLVDASDRVRGRLDVRLRRIEHLPERLLRRRELRPEAAQARRQALREGATVDRRRGNRRRRRRSRRPRRSRTVQAAAFEPPLEPPFWPAACRSTPASPANCAAVGRGMLRLIWKVWPPRLQLRDDLRDHALLVLGEQGEARRHLGDAVDRRDLRRGPLVEGQLRSGQEEVVDEVGAGLAELRQIRQHRLIRPDEVAAAAAAAPARRSRRPGPAAARA